MFMSITRPRRALVAAFAISVFCWCAYLWGLSFSWRRSSAVLGELRKPWHSSSSDLQDGNATNLSWSSPRRINATIIALVRNSEVDGMVQSMRELERAWNHKFNYPWTFFNDEPFDDEFKRLTRNETKAECTYELIPRGHWEPPPWIDQDRFKNLMQDLARQRVRYADLASYHKMCRWNSGFFYKHRALANFKWYWRVEPNVRYYCNIDYDVFAYLQDNNKTYGFTISAYDNPLSVATLWPETMKFVDEHPEYISSNNLMAWLTDGAGRPDDWMANGYSTCHFWSNFEIADMDFWRSRAYEDYFNHLDRAGGFFYERWGDAPVHSVALGLFEDASRLHWFKDIGYEHDVFANCPPECKNCSRGFSSRHDLELVNCLPNWLKHQKLDDGGVPAI